MPVRLLRAWVVVGSLLACIGCSNGDSPPATGGNGGAGGAGGNGGVGGEDEFGRCSDFDELRQVYWGDTHVHTTLSFDANMQGTRTTQEDAYAFARGEAIPLQPYAQDGNPTRMAQIDRPLDFVMLSDHAEFLGTLGVCNDPESLGYDSAQCVDYRAAQAFDADPQEVIFVFVAINGLLAFDPEDAHYPELCGTDDELCLEPLATLELHAIHATLRSQNRSNRIPEIKLDPKLILQVALDDIRQIRIPLHQHLGTGLGNGYIQSLDSQGFGRF